MTHKLLRLIVRLLFVIAGEVLNLEGIDGHGVRRREYYTLEAEWLVVHREGKDA